MGIYLAKLDKAIREAEARERRTWPIKAAKSTKFDGGCQIGGCRGGGVVNLDFEGGNMVTRVRLCDEHRRMLREVIS